MTVTIQKRGVIVYLLILGGSLWFASFYGGPVAFVWLYAICLLIPVSILYSILNYHCLRIYQEIEVHKVTRGEAHTYRTTIENAGILPIYRMGIYLFTERCQLADIEDGMPISLDGFEKQEITSGIICRYAGAYNVGIEKISLADPFHLYEVMIEIPYTFKAVVNPPVTDKAFAALEIENLVNSTGLKSDMSYEDILGSDVRAYERGDAFKSINWKVSAKLSKLMVRTPDKMEKSKVTMLLLAAKAPVSKQDLEYLKRSKSLSADINLVIQKYQGSNNQQIFNKLTQEEKKQLIYLNGIDQNSKYSLTIKLILIRIKAILRTYRNRIKAL